MISIEIDKEQIEDHGQRRIRKQMETTRHNTEHFGAKFQARAAVAPEVKKYEAKF